MFYDIHALSWNKTLSRLQKVFEQKVAHNRLVIMFSFPSHNLLYLDINDHNFLLIILLSNVIVRYFYKCMKMKETYMSKKNSFHPDSFTVIDEAEADSIKSDTCKANCVDSKLIRGISSGEIQAYC